MKTALMLLLSLGCALAQQAVVRNAIPQTGLIGQYLPKDISGSTLTDSSPAGNNGALVGSPSSTASTLTLVRGSTQYITLPNAVRDAWKSICIAGDFVQNAPTGSNFATLVGSSANALALAQNNIFTGGLNIFAPAEFNGGGTKSGQSIGGPGVVCFVTNGAGVDQWYINGKEAPSYFAQGVTGAATNFGGGVATMQIGANTGNPGAFQGYNGNIYGVWAYSGSLSALQVADLSSEAVRITSALGASYVYMNTTTSSPLVFLGDSLVNGTGIAQTLCANSNISPTDTYTVFCNGIAGITAVQINGMVDFLNILYAPRAQHNTLVLFTGTNDASAGAAEGAIRAIATTARQRGWQVVVSTLISRAAEATTQQPVSNWIRQNWRSFADSLADPAADIRLGGTGAFNSLVYFQGDGVHPTQVGQNLIATVDTKAINALNGWSAPGCLTSTITSTNEGFNVAAVSADIQIALPQQFTKLIGATVKHSTAFTGTGLTSLTVSLGDSTSVTAYTPTFNIFQAVSTTTFQDTALFKSTTMSAAPPVVNAHFIANTNLGQASKSITAATNANPSVYTSTAHGLAAGQNAFVTGFTGSWAVENGNCVVSATNLTANAFQCTTVNGLTAPNATGFGALAGTPVFTSNFLLGGSVDMTLCAIPSIQ